MIQFIIVKYEPIASPSPCLQVEPENTSSPTDLVTGNDSPVNAA
jgi:hypothetical protein